MNIKYITNANTALYIDMSTSLNDLSGNSYNGSASNTTTVNTGIFGTAYSHGGVNGYIDFTNGLSNLLSGNFTIHMVMKIAASGDRGGIYKYKVDVSPTYNKGWLFEYYNSSVYGGIGNGGTGSPYNTSITYTPDANYHLYTWTRTGNGTSTTGGAIYVDGVSYTVSTGNTNSPVETTDSIYTGRFHYANFGYLYYKNTMQSIIIEKTSWTATQVNKFYQETFKPY